MFTDQFNFDFHLKEGSSCNNSGADSVEPGGDLYYAPKIDFENNPRPNPSETAPDIGAFESKSSKSSN